MGYAQRVQLHRRIAKSLAQGRASGLKVTPAELASHHEAGREIPAALRSYAAAAEMALSQLAPREAVDLTTHALSLLSQCPEGPERLELELAVAARRGMACSQVYGIASGEAAVAIDRAREICDLLPQTPERALLITGLGWLIYARGEYEKALTLGRGVFALATEHENPVLVVSACNLMGITCATRGELLQACEWFERGIATRDALGDRLPLAPFLMDPGVTMRGVHGIVLACRGLAVQARAQSAIALEHAARVGQPMARSLALRSASTIEMRLRNPKGVLQHTAELQKIIDSHALTPPVGPNLWLTGWAKAELGDPQAGLELIQSGHEQHLRFGMLTGSVEAQMIATRVLVTMQDWPRAQAHLNEGLQLCQRLGEGMFLPDFRLMQGRIAAAGGRAAEARDMIGSAVEIARMQGALQSEIDGWVALAELDIDRPAALCELAAAMERLTEGRDLPVWATARELLTR
jgi:hypothetical protein